jgi:hypothetical protein
MHPKKKLVHKGLHVISILLQTLVDKAEWSYGPPLLKLLKISGTNQQSPPPCFGAKRQGPRTGYAF